MMNCVFYTIWGNKYDDILKISLNTLKNIDKSIDIKIYTDHIINGIDDNNKQIIYDFNGERVISMSRRYLIASNLLDIYDKVLHLDVDTVCTKDINELFSNLNENKIYVASELSNDSVTGVYWAGDLMNSEDMINYKHIDSICAGVWLCNKNMSRYMLQLYDYICTNHHRINNICLDQPFFCYFLIKNNIYDFGLQKYVSHNSKIVKNIIHFAGGVSPNNDKKNNMRIYDKR